MTDHGPLLTARRPEAAEGSIALGFYLLWIVAFPKAGVKLAGTYPLTPGLLLGCAAAMLSLGRLHSARIVLGPRAYRQLRALWWVSSVLALVSVIEYGLAATLEKAAPVLLPAFGVPWVIAHLRQHRDPVGFFLRVAAIPLGYGFLQLLLGRASVAVPGLTVNLSDWRELGTAVFESKNNSTEVGLKLVSTYQNGNLYGVLIVTVFTLTLGRIVQRRSGTYELVLFCASAASAVLTLSRTCLIACVVVVCFFVILAGVRRAAAVIVLLTAGMLAVMSSSFGQRLFHLDTSGAGRVPMYQEYLREAVSLPLGTLLRFIVIGLGPGVDGLQDLTPPERIPAKGIPFVENVALNLLLMGGLVLTIGYLLPIASLARRGIRAHQLEARATAVALFALLVYFALDQSLNLPPSGSLLWLMYALLSVQLAAPRPSDRGVAPLRSTQRALGASACPG